MIDLSVQLKLIIFSFIFGFFLTMILEKYNKKTINKSFAYQFIIGSTIILILDAVYFIGIYTISNAIFHVYLIISVLLGMIIYKLIMKKIS